MSHETAQLLSLLESQLHTCAARQDRLFEAGQQSLAQKLACCPEEAELWGFKDVPRLDADGLRRALSLTEDQLGIDYINAGAVYRDLKAGSTPDNASDFETVAAVSGLIVGKAWQGYLADFVTDEYTGVACLIPQGNDSEAVCILPSSLLSFFSQNVPLSGEEKELYLAEYLAEGMLNALRVKIGASINEDHAHLAGEALCRILRAEGGHLLNQLPQDFFEPCNFQRNIGSRVITGFSTALRHFWGFIARINGFYLETLGRKPCLGEARRLYSAWVELTKVLSTTNTILLRSLELIYAPGNQKPHDNSFRLNPDMILVEDLKTKEPKVLLHQDVTSLLWLFLEKTPRGSMMNKVMCAVWLLAREDGIDLFDEIADFVFSLAQVYYFESV